MHHEELNFEIFEAIKIATGPHRGKTLLFLEDQTTISANPIVKFVVPGWSYNKGQVIKTLPKGAIPINESYDLLFAA